MHKRLRVVKCRSSKLSERSHEYRIMSGIGISIQHKKPEKQPKRKVADKVAEKFKEDVKKLPRATRGRLLKGFKRLQDADFEIIDPDVLVDDIIEEYK